MAGLDGGIASTTETLIRRLPKAELHVHIEGTLEAGMMLQVGHFPGPALAAACQLALRS
jgi:adenosine deaminase